MVVPEGWSIVDGRLHRSFAFRDFSEAWGFMSRVALVAERMGHHPDWSNTWNRVVIDLVTHDEHGAVTEKDTALAAAVNRLL